MDLLPAPARLADAARGSLFIIVLIAENKKVRQKASWKIHPVFRKLR
jgi:hypothetical protein